MSDVNNMPVSLVRQQDYRRPEVEFIRVWVSGTSWVLRNNRKHKAMYARFDAMLNLLDEVDGVFARITLDEYRALRDGK